MADYNPATMSPTEEWVWGNWVRLWSEGQSGKEEEGVHSAVHILVGGLKTKYPD